MSTPVTSTEISGNYSTLLVNYKSFNTQVSKYKSILNRLKTVGPENGDWSSFQGYYDDMLDSQFQSLINSMNASMTLRQELEAAHPVDSALSE